MIAHCAAPGCGARFRLWEGKLFHFNPTHRPAADAEYEPGEHFWLCGPCSELFAIRFDPQGHPVVVVQEGELSPHEVEVMAGT